MTKVTKESLVKRINDLEIYKSCCSLSLNEEYQLAAYEMLLNVFIENDRYQKEMDDLASELKSKGDL